MAMTKIFQGLAQFKRDTSGATAMEYGLILALLSIVVTTAAATIGTHLTDMFQRVVDFLA
jgi:pilus assembly protein Flp/PilA